MRIIDEAFAGIPVSVPIIDAHTHILEYTNIGWYQSFASNAEIIAVMDHVGVDCIVTTPHSLVLGDMEFTNRVAAEAAEEFPGRIYAYIAVLPHEGIDSVRNMLNKYAANGSFVGLKFLAGYHGPLACAEYDYALDFASEMKCPVLSHIWANKPSLKDVERAVKGRQGLKLMMAHQGGGSAGCTDEYIKLMKDYPNLYMEICGSLNNRYSIEELAAMAGEDRVIYGSDFINLDLRFDFGKVVFSPMEDSVKRKILAENFLNLLKGSQMGQIYLNK